MSARSFGHEVLLPVGVDEAVARVAAALQAQGFGVLSDIDVAATLARKLGVEVPAYRILGACNPALAHRALQVDASVGLFLPCNVVVRAVDGGSEVQFLSPARMFSVVDMPALDGVAADAETRIAAAARALA